MWNFWLLINESLIKLYEQGFSLITNSLGHTIMQCDCGKYTGIKRWSLKHNCGDYTWITSYIAFAFSPLQLTLFLYFSIILFARHTKKTATLHNWTFFVFCFNQCWCFEDLLIKLNSECEKKLILTWLYFLRTPRVRACKGNVAISSLAYKLYNNDLRYWQ